VYTSSVLRGAPYAFIKFHLLIKKKKNIKRRTYQKNIKRRIRNASSREKKDNGKQAKAFGKQK
jgi:hypothetical protein